MGPFSNASKPMSFEVGLCIMPSSSSVKCGVLCGCVHGYVAVAARKSVRTRQVGRQDQWQKDQHFSRRAALHSGSFHDSVMSAMALVWGRIKMEQ